MSITSWLHDHYETVLGEWQDNADGSVSRPMAKHLRCRRCQQPVYWVTKHAAVRHGDDVEVLPPTESAHRELLHLY